MKIIFDKWKESLTDSRNLGSMGLSNVLIGILLEFIYHHPLGIAFMLIGVILSIYACFLESYNFLNNYFTIRASKVNKKIGNRKNDYSN